jgi:hypothetical protein
MKNLTFVAVLLIIISLGFEKISFAQTCESSLAFATNPTITYLGLVSGKDRVKVDWSVNPSPSCNEVLVSSTAEVHVVLHRSVTVDRATVKVPMSQNTVTVEFPKNALETNPKSIEATVSLRRFYHVQSGGSFDTVLDQASMKLKDQPTNNAAPGTCEVPVRLTSVVYKGQVSGKDSFEIRWSIGPAPACACAPPVSNLRVTVNVMRTNGKTDSASEEPIKTTTNITVNVPRGVLDKNPANVGVFLFAGNDLVCTKVGTKSITIP